MKIIEYYEKPVNRLSFFIYIEVLHKFAKLRNSAIMEENVRFCRGDSLYNSNVFFHNGGKLRNLAFVKDLYTSKFHPTSSRKLSLP